MTEVNRSISRYQGETIWPKILVEFMLRRIDGNSLKGVHDKWMDEEK